MQRHLAAKKPGKAQGLCFIALYPLMLKRVSLSREFNGLSKLINMEFKLSIGRLPKLLSSYSMHQSSTYLIVHFRVSYMTNVDRATCGAIQVRILKCVVRVAQCGSDLTFNFCGVQLSEDWPFDLFGLFCLEVVQLHVGGQLVKECRVAVTKNPQPNISGGVDPRHVDVPESVLGTTKTKLFKMLYIVFSRGGQTEKSFGITQKTLTFVPRVKVCYNKNSI